MDPRDLRGNAQCKASVIGQFDKGYLARSGFFLPFLSHSGTFKTAKAPVARASGIYKSGGVLPSPFKACQHPAGFLIARSL